MTLFAPVMFRDEMDMLEARLLEYEVRDIVHVVVEAPVTHRNVPKPLAYEQNRERFAKWNDSIVHVVAAGLAEPMKPWAREHAQRDAAWPAIDERAADGDIVLIGDLDEFPSAEALAWDGTGGVVSLWMRTMLYAVDWEAVPDGIPPTAVMATAGWLREHGNGHLGTVRDGRASYPVIRDGGIHLSWVGGPEWQHKKLTDATCHTEVFQTPEALLIATGERYRAGSHGGTGLPVVPVEADESWPRYVRERRCPAEWFRPRGQAS